MTLNFLEKKKETFILLGIVILIVTLIFWFYFDTLQLGPKTEKPPTTVDKKEKAVAQPSTNVVRKKIGAPAEDQESLPETKTESSDTDTIALAPDNQDEKKPEDKPVDEIADKLADAPSSDTLAPDNQDEKKTEDKPVDEIADKPVDAPSSDTLAPDNQDEKKPEDKPVDEIADKSADAPSSDTPASTDALETEEDGEVVQPSDKTPEEVEAGGEEKASSKDEVDETPVTPDTSELKASSYRIRQPLHPYSIKLSSNRLKNNAQNGVKVFKNDKTDPYVVQMDLGAERGIWWNVYTGHYKTRKDALNILKTLDRPDARIKKLSYANMIDEFSSEEKMAAVYQRLEKQGYEPYVIRDSDKWRLFVGDFLYAEGAAQRSQADLKDAGFTSSIVKR
ncbi:SPOR domain-containing protein [Desulfococcaceae bacterium HSG9]|nr:SPOR domain-containing protein [Desulfococcaceae bacterium HSG9]